jgi:protein tyrosine/serine phosphatase
MKKYSLPFPRSYWVVPGEFLAGYYPGSRDLLTAQAKLKNLLEHGIRHIINLIEREEDNFQGEKFVPYEDQLQTMAEEMDILIELVHMPIRDMKIPPLEVMVSILDEIDQAIEHNPAVYLHCWGGRGRTGTVVGCYLARHGMAVGEAALDLLGELRQNDPISHLSSPETKMQAEFVRKWPKGR